MTILPRSCRPWRESDRSWPRWHYVSTLRGDRIGPRCGCLVRVGLDPARRSLEAPHDNLPTAQGLDAEGEVINGQGPVAYPCSPELLNRHRELLVIVSDATRDGDELSGHVQGHGAVEAPFPAGNFAEDIPRKGAAELVKAIDVPPGRVVRIERGVNFERGGPLRERGGVHDGRAPAIDGRHH